MQREMAELHGDVVFVYESFNTDRTEIAPRSDVIGEDFEDGCGFGAHVRDLDSVCWNWCDDWRLDAIFMGVRGELRE